MKKRKSVESHLPKRPPLASGKRGIGPKVEPLDPVKDFETPTKQEPTQEVEQAEQGSLLAKQPKKAVVVGNRMEIFYDKPVFAKWKDTVIVALVCTMPVEKEHEDLLPKMVRDAYHDIKKKGRKNLTLKDADLPGQRAVFYLSSDIKEEALVLPAAKLIHVSLADVQRKGEGVSRNVIRLSLRLQVPLSHEVATFAEHNIRNSFWMTLEDTEEGLFDSEE